MLGQETGDSLLADDMIFTRGRIIAARDVFSREAVFCVGLMRIRAFL